MTQVFKNWLSTWTSVLQLAAAVSGILTAVAFVLWKAFSPILTSTLATDMGIQEIVQTQVATKELVEQTSKSSQRRDEALGVQVVQLSAQVELLDQRIANVEPEPRVAEYDNIRSRIMTDTCKIGEPCRFQMRARRTTYGEGCQTVKISGYLVDYQGDGHFPELIDMVPRSITTRWTVIDERFRVPGHATPGDADFFIILDYECPGPDNVWFRDSEESIHLTVELTNGVGDAYD